VRNLELNGPYFPGHLKGDRVWLCARAEELRAWPYDASRLGPNLVSSRLLRVSERAQAVRLEFDSEIAVDVPREQFERQKDNREWLVEFPPHVLRVL
jgi:hypothetical protein